ncbi:hypothetical protein BOTBODRAFT_36992, partial [Botryobasidium botryosum FD-172 SS1]
MWEAALLEGVFGTREWAFWTERVGAGGSGRIRCTIISEDIHRPSAKRLEKINCKACVDDEESVQGACN